MRIIIFLFLISFITIHVYSQAPSKKEMQEQMNQMKNELNKQIADLEKQIAEAKKNKENPETIKELEDQLSLIKKQLEMMGSVSKGISKVPDKTFEQAAADKTIPDIPKKDIARIKQLPDKILTDAELIPYIKKIHSEVEKLLKAEDIAEASKFYAALKQEKRTANEINNAVSCLWLAGYPEIALYMIGKECVANMNNPNILNTYASFLAMKGGEHAALPILQNLNKNFPNNSTILNNISQAWFGLGDINNAEKFLDETMRAFGNHSQANQTKCAIQKSRGQKQQACESIKRAIQENYTSEKESKLEELGGKLEYDDIKFRYPIKANALGLQKFYQLIPDCPLQGGETASRSQSEWHFFKEAVMEAREAVEKKIEILKVKVDAHHKRQLANPKLLLPYNNPVHITAKRKMQLLGEWAIDRTLAQNKEAMAAAVLFSTWKTEYDKAMEGLTDCGARKQAATVFLTKANGLQRQLNDKMIIDQKLTFNATANLAMYYATDQSEYELIIETIKLGVLTSLNGLYCWFELGCVATDTPEQGLRGPLPDFDSLTCQYKDEIKIPPFTTIKTECNKMTTEFDIDLETKYGIKIKIGLEEDLRNLGSTEWYRIDKTITKATLEIAKEFGPKDPTLFGPADAQVIGAELKGELRAGIEITGEGIQEVYIKGSTTLDLAGNIGDAEITPNVQSDPKGVSVMSSEVKISWNVGSGSNSSTMNSSLTGGGMLSPINLSLR